MHALHETLPVCHMPTAARVVRRIRPFASVQRTDPPSTRLEGSHQLSRLQLQPSSLSTTSTPISPSLALKAHSTMECQLAGTSDQLNKRSRSSKSPVVADLLCLHCNAIGHAWSQCEALCLQCWDRHPRQRCANLSVDNYTPGAFTLFNASDTVDTGEPEPLSNQEPMCGIPIPNLDAGLMEGVSAERQAMIAATPEPLPEPREALSVEDGGRLRTGMNAMPLGGFTPHLTRLNLAPQQHSSKKAHLKKLDTKKPAQPKVKHSKYLKRWQGLELQVRSVVQGAENPDLATNNGRDRAEVWEAVDKALEVLRPAILR
ncbi:uncharacterized protein MYCFIDRAFT_197560 [Pseudocercospora fijiensis CIRAD86]|uniref:Uncharacterized protein n=1 Tax=Pseudocercospora fijiensis (strain CIRAD86) TaxID=383855 RepID=M3AZ04_PSEFD|nr:uncharacterized protein MYCFIDRAFT_197560 [Pseudocercospora fijiensis CIRAD86]EME82437.1 hypothetical protein MYCFIDRAFT_197560 [Pseudocercospora fijiensis CIRAD86]